MSCSLPDLIGHCSLSNSGGSVSNHVRCIIAWPDVIRIHLINLPCAGKIRQHSRSSLPRGTLRLPPACMPMYHPLPPSVPCSRAPAQSRHISLKFTNHHYSHGFRLFLGFDFHCVCPRLALCRKKRAPSHLRLSLRGPRWKRRPGAWRRSWSNRSLSAIPPRRGPMGTSLLGGNDAKLE